MSNLVFPTLPGLEWNVTRAPIWSTTKKQSVSGRQFRVANFSFPRYRYSMSFSVLRQGGSFTELAQVVGLFNQVYGDFDSWLFTDPDDNAVTAQAFGAGDGATRAWQLVRAWGSFVEPVYDANSAPQIYVAGVLKTAGTDYTISATGLVTFATAPTGGQALTWTGSYYRRVVFCNPSYEFNKFSQALWDLKKIDFESWRP